MATESLVLKRSNREKQRKLQAVDEDCFQLDPLNRSFWRVILGSKWFPFYLLRHHWNLKKDIDDLKLANEKLRRQSATINQRTEHLESHRLDLEKSLNELTEQLNALDQQQFNVNGEKKTLGEMQSLVKVSDDQNSVLKGIEKMSLGKLNYLFAIYVSWKVLVGKIGNHFFNFSIFETIVPN